MIYLSFSSIPPRLPHIKDTIDSILNQSLSEFLIVFNFPTKYIRFKDSVQLPDFLKHPKVIINSCEDFGPATKLLPTLKLMNDDDLVVTFDDDREYPHMWLENLITSSNNYNACLGYRGKCLQENLLYESGVPSPDVSFPKRVDILTGVWGNLYKKRFFDDSVFDILSAPTACISNDDIWFSGHLARRGIPRLLLENPGIIDQSTQMSVYHALHLTINAGAITNNIAIDYFKEDFKRTRVLQ